VTARARVWCGLAVALAMVVGIGCGDAQGNLLVRFLSERQIPAEAETLEVAVFAGDDGGELGRARYPLAPIGRFPATLGITPGGDAPARVLIVGWLYLGDAIVASGAAEPALISEASRQVDVELVEDVPP
jgi:hypothetical protein